MTENSWSGKRIVHVVTTVRHGGAERVVLDLARRQRAAGAVPQIICLHDTGELLPLFTDAGIPVKQVDHGQAAGALRCAWRLAGLLGSTAPDVVHTHNAAPQIAAGLGQWLRHWRQPGTVLVHTEHGRLSDLRPGLLRLRRWTAANFDAVIAVSTDTREHLLAHGIRSRTGVDVLHNGIDLDRFQQFGPGPSRTGSRLVHVGRLDRIKGQDVLIEAMSTVHDAMPDVRLTIVGDGPLRAELTAQAQARHLDTVVEFVGAVADVRPFLQHADLFVLPSRSEGISLALLEAMASGLPVVATDVGGNREVIASDACGTLVPTEQPALLAQAMMAMLRQPQATAIKGTAARREVERRFSLDRTMASYWQYYNGTRPAQIIGAVESVV